MERKGQKSLEMIIGLVILLVVAGVVISTFLNQFQSNPASQYEDTLKKEEVKNTCSQLCGTYKDATGKNALTAAFEYCTRTFRMDVDGDGSTSEVAGSLYNSYCEDGVHCFNQHTCEVGYNKLDASECRQLMCEYYETVSNIPDSNASERIRRFYVPSGQKDRTIGTCGLPKVESTTGQPIKTWYSENFQGSNLCDYNVSGSTSGPSGPPGPPAPPP